MKSRGSKGIAVRYRPQTFPEVIGHKRTLDAIRQIWAKQKQPTAWMFSGDSGTGKTTLARIMARSINCIHQTEFGSPCLECRRSNNFEIKEINASSSTGKDDIGEEIVGWNHLPMGDSNSRIFILDESQKLSNSSQNMLLKPFEDGPKTTFWFICTTEPHKIIKTLRRRCIHFHLPCFKPQAVEELVREVLTLEKVDFEESKIEQFLSLLYERQYNTPGLVLPLVEKFIAARGEPNCVNQVEGEGANWLAISRAAFQGNWDEVRDQYEQVSGSDLIGLRNSIAGYFRSVLKSQKISAKAFQIVKCLELLAKVPVLDEGFAYSYMLAVLYTVSMEMKKSTA